MVNSVRNSEFVFEREAAVRPSGGASGSATITPVRPVPQASPEACVRCGMRLFVNYDEKQCPTCGYTDYSMTVEVSRGRKTLLSTATRHVFRYAGDSPALRETLTHATLVRIRNRVGYKVSCPFCNETMEESSLSGKRPEAREQRYKCSLGHRVSLIPGKNGMTGWR